MSTTESFAQGVRLSVLVPVYNERYLVEESLDRVFCAEMPSVSELEVVVVDDGSTDGTAEVLRRIAGERGDALRLITKPANEGKGSAIRTAIEAATGDLIVFQDADLEYDPSELERLVRPFLEDGADVVYGSRFAASERRRVIYFRHTVGNRVITFLSNLFTDLNLSDVETCYKMFRGPLLKSIPLRSNDFGMEIEITAKVAKRNATVYEVPISYRGRTYREGKKIGWRDGVKALITMVRFWLIDDLYREDAYGGRILHSLERARRFNRWMAEVVEPALGARVLEIGAGIGNMTGWLIPRDSYLATDINENYLGYLRNFAAGKPYLDVARVDLEEPESFEPLTGRFDSVICLNVLEHVADPHQALANLYGALAPGGRLVIYVPRGEGLYSSLDEALGHRCRYERDVLRSELEAAGFTVESIRDFNRTSVPGWWWNGKVLRRRGFSRVQMKILDLLVPVIRLLDRLLPWSGLGLVAVSRKPAAD